MSRYFVSGNFSWNTQFQHGMFVYVRCSKIVKKQQKIDIFLVSKGQIISKGPLVSSNSPKKWTNEFVFTSMRRVFVCFLGESLARKKSFRDYLTFKRLLSPNIYFTWIATRKQQKITLFPERVSNLEKIRNTIEFFHRNVSPKNADLL